MSLRFGYIGLTLPVIALCACSNTNTYWRNINPARENYFTMDTAQCDMYARANSSDEVVDPGTRSGAANGFLMAAQIVGNISNRSNLYNTCMTAKGWSRYTVVNDPPQTSIAPPNTNSTNRQSPMQEYSQAYSRKDYIKAFNIARTLASQGNPVFQNYLGIMYLNGQGVTRDDIEAVRLFRLSADQKHPSGQHNLGFMYQNGRGVTRDDIEAVRLFRLSADQNNPAGQNQLGVMYQNGRGVTRDDIEAVRLFRLSADQNNPAGQHNLGFMYLNGLGVARDDIEAVRFIRLSAAQNSASGQFSLAQLYERGVGVAADASEALRLYRLSAEQGHAGSRQALNRLSPNQAP